MSYDRIVVMKFIRSSLSGGSGLTDRELTPRQYRQRWELPFSYPLVAPNYAKTRSTLAKQIGLGRTGRGAPKKAGRKAPRKMAARQR